MSSVILLYLITDTMLLYLIIHIQLCVLQPQSQSISFYCALKTFECETKRWIWEERSVSCFLLQLLASKYVFFKKHRIYITTSILWPIDFIIFLISSLVSLFISYVSPGFFFSTFFRVCPFSRFFMSWNVQLGKDLVMAKTSHATTATVLHR